MPSAGRGLSLDARRPLSLHPRGEATSRGRRLPGHGGGEGAGYDAEAEAVFEKALAVREDPTNLTNLGVIRAARGRTNEGIPLLARALEIDPDYGNALWSLARIRFEERNPVAAESLLRHLLSIEPGRTEALRLLGRCLLATDRPAEAIPHLRAATERSSGDSPLGTDLGVALARAGKVDEARVALRKACDLDPENRIARNLRESLGD
ncbi:MAG: tetratricopeptide repeat protein [Candidatus Eisenbacteria bacterium]